MLIFFFSTDSGQSCQNVPVDFTQKDILINLSELKMAPIFNGFLLDSGCESWSTDSGVWCILAINSFYPCQYPGLGREEKLCIRRRLSPSLANSQIVNFVFILPSSLSLLVTTSHDHWLLTWCQKCFHLTISRETLTHFITGDLFSSPGITNGIELLIFRICTEKFIPLPNF